jgi:diphthamide synthase (EF-2-diphthine--ammonia ligase)
LKAAISWSGGKDGLLALALAREAGVEVRSLVCFADPDGHSIGHHLPQTLLRGQAARLGCLLLWRRVEPGRYAEVYDQALIELASSGHEALLTGDIDLQAHLDWIAPKVQAAGLAPLFPLWGLPRAWVARELIARGVQAQLVTVDCSRLPAAFCGRSYDEDLLAELPDGVCAVGEEGEFHSFVSDAPGLFAAPLRCRPGATRLISARSPMRPGTIALQTPELL